MLQQSARTIEPFVVAPAAPLDVSTGVEPMENITNTETAVEEDTCMKIHSLGSEGDEEAEQCCVASRKRTMSSPEANSRGQTAFGGSCTHQNSDDIPGPSSSTVYDSQQEPQGLGLIRLLQFSGTLSNESPQKHHLGYWNDLISEYFTPGAIIKLTFWKDNQLEAMPFEIDVPILPRFFLVTTQSGVKSMTLSLESAKERIYKSGHSVVDCPSASWTYRYTNGYTVTLRGPLSAHVIATSSSLLGNNDTVYKFDEFRFEALLHDKFIAPESILGSGAGSIGNLLPSTPMTTSGIGSSQKELRVQIDNTSLPLEPVNPFNIPQAAMRCLELAETVTSMAELIQFAKASSHGPFDALKEYARRLRISGAVHPHPQPPVHAQPVTFNPQFYQAPSLAASSTTLYSPSKQTDDAIPTIASTSRKRAKTKSSTNSSTSNGRKNLSLLPTMHFDILQEIFGHLPPKDILSVSRASKIFRKTLLTRNATTVWKAARDRLGAPECPSWMSEPAWAALLFGHICQSCGTSNVHNVDFLLLKRVCASCKKTHLLIRWKTFRYSSILDLVPSTNARFHGYGGNNNYYWDTDLEGMLERLSKLEADVKNGLANAQKILFDFKEEQKQRVTQIQQASPQWRTWFGAVQLERYQEKREARDKRSEQIKEKFRELGYTNEDLFFPRSSKEFWSIAPLTEKSWKRIRTIFEPQAMDRKAYRLRRVRSDRINIIHLGYKDYQRTLHPSQWKYLPHTREIIGYEPFARHVDASVVEVVVTLATFANAFAHLPELLASAMEERKKSLQVFLPHSPDEDEKIDDPMVLAASVFQCKEDSALLFGWDEIASHHCQEREWDYNSDPQSQTTTAPPLVEYSPFAANVVKRVAGIVGLDGATATPADLDERDLRFSCDSCWPYRVGVDYYETGHDWRTLADHLLSMNLAESHNPSLSITVLSSEDAMEVRQCESEEKISARQWTCTHCSEHLDNLQTRQDVLQHLVDSHAIAAPCERTDFLFSERCKKGWVNPPRFTTYKMPIQFGVPYASHFDSMPS